MSALFELSKTGSKIVKRIKHKVLKTKKVSYTKTVKFTEIFLPGVL